MEQNKKVYYAGIAGGIVLVFLICSLLLGSCGRDGGGHDTRIKEGLERVETEQRRAAESTERAIEGITRSEGSAERIGSSVERSEELIGSVADDIERSAGEIDSALDRIEAAERT